MQTNAFRCVSVVAAVVLVGVALAAQSRGPAVPAIDAEALVRHVKVLASDEFEGRAPGTRGEDRTVAYIAEQYAKAGLAPGNLPAPGCKVTAFPRLIS